MLTVVGTGYHVAGQVTPEARNAMSQADRLFYLVTDPATGTWIRSLRSDAVSLHDCYRVGESGLDSSRAMVSRLLEAVEQGLDVCFAVSGHPALGMHTTHAALREAREAGHQALMLPGISFEDCLVADLGIDPGRTGRALYEATDFVLRPRPVDPGVALVLIQVGAIGERNYREGSAPGREGLRILQEVLLRHYPTDHEATLYEISQLPVAEPTIIRLPLGELAKGPVRIYSTLYVPPKERPARDPAVLRRLGLGRGGGREATRTEGHSP